MLCNEIKRLNPLAIILTPMRHGSRMPQFPWLDRRYPIDHSNWILLTPEAWESLGSGDERLWAGLQRKLLLSCYQYQPEIIAVVGYPDQDESEQAAEKRREEVQEIATRLRDCNLPVEVRAYWSRSTSGVEEIIAPAATEREVQVALWH